jgi:hypothetical protein
MVRSYARYSKRSRKQKAAILLNRVLQPRFQGGLSRDSETESCSASLDVTVSEKAQADDTQLPSQSEEQNLQLVLGDTQVQLQKLKAMHNRAQTKLQAEREQSKTLTQALRNEVQKVSRTKSAKLDAETSAAHAELDMTSGK